MTDTVRHLDARVRENDDNEILDSESTGPESCG